MNVEQIQKKVKALSLNEVLHNADTSEKFALLYKQAFPNETLCSTCPGHLQEAYNRIINLSPLKIHVMTNSKYRVRDNGIIDLGYNQIPGVPVHVTNQNLTDAIAEKLLKHNPNFKNQIEELHQGNEKKVKAADTETPEGGKGEKSGDVAADPVALLIANNKREDLIDKLKKIQKKNPEFTFDASGNKEALAKAIADFEATEL